VLSSLVAQTRPGAKLAVPVTAPSLVEAVTRRTEGTVARTKTDPRFLMTLSSLSAENVAFAGDMDGGFIFPDFHPAFDGMFAFVKTLEMLSWLQRPLSEFGAELPPMFLEHTEVRCPWEAKGKVMRVLTEESRDGKAELIDGIKLIQSENNWTLVLPDASEPLFHIYAEAPTREQAQQQAGEYARRIEAISK
jgi:mannose-1-phosphate guanylyltransferase/phosphomannomutase